MSFPPTNQVRLAKFLVVLLASISGAQVRPAAAGLINFTGHVAQDFSTPAAQGHVYTIEGQPGSVAEASYIIRNGWTSGFLIESARFAYDRASDTLFVGVQTVSITGDADGNGDPGRTVPQMAASGGINFPHFGGDKTLTVAFASIGPGSGMTTPLFVAGIPADKALGDSRNTNDFAVAAYRPDDRGLGYSYGSLLSGHVGALAVDPSASMPNFEFALTGVRSLAGFNPAAGFYADVFLGSERAIVVGKNNLFFSEVPGLDAAPAHLDNPPGFVNVPLPSSSVFVIHPNAGGNAVPEPGSALLVAVGGFMMAVGGRVRRRVSRRGVRVAGS